MVQLGVVEAVTISVLLLRLFADCAQPTPLGPTLLWGPGSIPNNCADVCRFLKPPGSQRFRKVNLHGAVSIPRQALGLRLSDQSCHHETRLHLHFVDWSNQWLHQARYNGNIRFTERPTNLEIVLPNVTQAKYWATTRSHLDCSTSFALGSHGFPCSSSRSELMGFCISSISSVFSCDLLIMIFVCTLSPKKT